jgi:hypothetical protein
MLINTANAINAAAAGAGAVPLQAVAIQEAAAAPGSIAAALAGVPPPGGALNPFVNFVVPQRFSREHPPLPNQPNRVLPSRAYRLSWLVADGNALAGVGGFAFVNLSPNVDAGVAGWIAALNLAPVQLAAMNNAANNMRWPLYQHRTVNGGANNIHFFTWHVPLRVNWLGANIFGPMAGPGLPEAIFMFENSTFLTTIEAGLGVGDVVVIAGDLNANGADMMNFFPNYIGVTAGLQHIIARSPSLNLAVNQNVAWATPFGPHAILAARTQW